MQVEEDHHHHHRRKRSDEEAAEALASMAESLLSLSVPPVVVGAATATTATATEAVPDGAFDDATAAVVVRPDGGDGGVEEDENNNNDDDNSSHNGRVPSAAPTDDESHLLSARIGKVLGDESGGRRSLSPINYYRRPLLENSLPDCCAAERQDGTAGAGSDEDRGLADDDRRPAQLLSPHRTSSVENPTEETARTTSKAAGRDEVVVESEEESVEDGDDSDGNPRNDDDDDDDCSSGASDVDTSTALVREEEIDQAKRQLGATSLAFIRRLRGAAFRRKQDLTRSRDSLAAKIAASRQHDGDTDRRRSEPTGADATGRNPMIPSNRRKLHPSSTSSTEKKSTFAALRLPPTTGPKGSGGMSGVPKVSKRQTTVPKSPLLGLRRGKPEPAAVATEYRRASATGTSSSSFKALPLPATTGIQGHAGQVGVPKVPKRQTTVPVSPLLGVVRRRARDIAPGAVRAAIADEAAPSGDDGAASSRCPPPLLPFEHAEEADQEERETLRGTDNGMSTSLASAGSNTSSLPLAGLSFVDTTSTSPSLRRRTTSAVPTAATAAAGTCFDLDPTTPCNINNVDDRSNKDANFTADDDRENRNGRFGAAAAPAFEPASTARARKRAQYDAASAEQAERRLAAAGADRRHRIRALKRELRALRKSL